MSAAGRALEVVHSNDPKDELWKRAKPLADHLNVYGDDALVAVYMRGGDGKDVKTAGGIILTEKTTAEDEFQGKIGLLMKVGPLFYGRGEGEDSNAAFFGDHKPKVGDWVMVRVGDTFSFKVKDQKFRMCEARALRAGVNKPDVIW